MTSSANRKYVPEIDHIRAYAALLVMLYHGLQLIGSRLNFDASFDASKHWLFTTNPIFAVIEEGHTGVGAFIVLSGFILSIGTVGHRIDYRNFIMARILRIYPLYIVFLFVGLYSNSNAYTIFSVLTSLLPFQNIPGGVGGDFTNMFWAVAVELQCYLIFPFLLKFSNEHGSRILWQIIAVAVVLRFAAVVGTEANARELSYWTIVGRIDQFCMGMIAARLYVGRAWVRDLRPTFVVMSVAAFIGVLLAFNHAGGWPSRAWWKVLWPTLEGAMWAAFILTYISAGRALPRFVNRTVAKLGEVSYSTYIAHIVVISVVLRLGLLLRLTGNGYYDSVATVIFVVFPVTTAFAFLSYNTIERPFLALRKQYVLDAPS